MTNDDSYRMMEALRRYMKLKVYETDKTVEIVLQFRTEDGKIHQLCNGVMTNRKFMEKVQ